MFEFLVSLVLGILIALLFQSGGTNGPISAAIGIGATFLFTFLSIITSHLRDIRGKLGKH